MLDNSSLPAPSDRPAVEGWLAAREAAAAKRTRLALRRIVRDAYTAFLDTLTADGDLNALDGIPGAWMTFVDGTLAPELGETHLAGAMTAWLGLKNQPTDKFAASWATVVNDNAVSYMRDATNRLSGVGDEAWRRIRQQTTNAIRDGLTTEQLKGKLEALTQFSEQRADTIARTETMGAYVQGDMGGARALGDKGPLEKVWVATVDRRTRETHIEAHNQVRVLSEPFDVGGYSMDSPHAPGAPAREVVNCRCYAEMLYAGDTRPDGSVVAAPGSTEVAAKAPESKPKLPPKQPAIKAAPKTPKAPPKPKSALVRRAHSRADAVAPKRGEINLYGKITGHNALSNFERAVGFNHRGTAVLFQTDPAALRYLEEHATDPVERLTEYLLDRHPEVDRIVKALDVIYEDAGDTASLIERVVKAPDGNPSDAYWAQRYNRPGFRSAATAGNRGITFYPGGGSTTADAVSTIRHEFGHIVDGTVNFMQTGVMRPWRDAMLEDSVAWQHNPKRGFNAPQFIREANDGHRVLPTSTTGITTYGQAAPAEDVAESIRLYLVDKANGRLTTDGVRFADMFPGRARIIDDLFERAHRFV